METTDGMLGGNTAVAPSGLSFGLCNADQGQSHSIRIGEWKHRVAEALFRRLVRHTLFNEAVRPVTERTCGDPERGQVCVSDARPSHRNVLPREEREDRPRMSDFIAVIQVVGPWIVEVDGFLDETQTERAGVEIKIAISPSRRSFHGAGWVYISSADSFRSQQPLAPCSLE